MKRMLSIVLSLCILLSCAALFSSCNLKASGEYPVTVGGIVIEKEPKNIVVLNDVLADIISYIGYDIKMVGRSEECDQDFLYVVPTVGKAAAPDIAAIKAAGADLVIADSTMGVDLRSNIEAEGIPVLTLSLPTDEASLEKLYTDLGTALGGKTTGSEKGAKSYKGLLDMLGTMNTATSNVSRSVAYLYLNENNELCSFVKGSLEYKFFNYNGNTNVLQNLSEPAVNTYELRLNTPSYLFCDNEAVVSFMKAEENCSHLTALAENKVCVIPMKAFKRFGTSTENAVYRMLSFIEKDGKATPDQSNAATTAAAPAETAAAPAATTAETAAPAATQGEDVITYSAQTE